MPRAPVSLAQHVGSSDSLAFAAFSDFCCSISHQNRAGFHFRAMGIPFEGSSSPSWLLLACWVSALEIFPFQGPCRAPFSVTFSCFISLWFWPYPKWSHLLDLWFLLSFLGVGKVGISGFIPEARKPQQCLLEAVALRPENVCRVCEILTFSPIVSSLLTDSWRYFTKEHALNSIWFISAGGIICFQRANGEKANVEAVFLSRD